MNYRKPRTIPLNAKTYMFGCFYVSIFFGFLLYFSTYISATVRLMSYVLSLVFGYLGILIYLGARTKKNNPGLIIWTLLFFYMLVIGQVMSRTGIGSYYFSNLLSQDLRYCMYAMMGFVFADELYFSGYVKTFVFIGKIGIIAGIFALASYSFDLSKVLSGIRLGIWELPYYCWWIIGTVSLFLFAYALFTGEHRTLGFMVHGFYLTLGLLFLKRAPVIETAIIVTCYTIFSRQKQRFLKVLLIGGVLVVIILMLGKSSSYFSALLNSLTARFEQEYSESSRASEVSYYLKNTSMTAKIFGYGLGNEFIFSGEHKNAIHIGFFDAMYKGGFFFLAYYAYLLISVIKLLYYRITDPEILTEKEMCAVTLTIVALVSLSFGMCFTYSMVILNYAPSFGIVILTARRVKERRKLRPARNVGVRYGTKNW